MAVYKRHTCRFSSAVDSGYSTMRLSVLTILALAALVRLCPGEKSARCAQVDCLARCLPLPMMKDMIKSLKSIRKPWQNEPRPHRRYIPKIKYIQRLNIADINKMLELYEDYVFKTLWISDTEYPKRFIHSFHTLKINVERCKDRDQAKLTQYAKKKLKTMEEVFKKLQPEELLSAAVDFETVLRWISLYIDKKVSHKDCQ